MKKILTVFAIVLLFGGCAVHTETISQDTGLFRKSSEAAALEASRQLDAKTQGLQSWNELAPAIKASLRYVNAKRPEEPAVSHGYLSVTWGEVAQSLLRLEALLPQLDKNPQLLAEHFTWYLLTPEAHYSGYYEAEFAASLIPTEKYLYPVYRTPKELRSVRLSDFHQELIGMRLIYRLDEKGAVRPYYTRRDIDEKHVLEGQNLELAWLSDPMDAYLLHLQGSGKLRFDDNTTQHILYDANNGHAYSNLGQTLAGRGLVPPTEVTVPYIRNWMKQHPEQQNDLLYANKRYVFFRFGDDGPYGGIGQKLTPLVSIAVDRTTFPLGGLIIYGVDLPQTQEYNIPQHIQGIGFAQDTGAAIKTRRMDLFCGSGAQAEFVAGHLNEKGQAWMLLAK